MNDRLFSLCAPCPAGFTYCSEFRKSEFRRGPFALYASTSEEAKSFFGKDLRQMAGVILIPGESLGAEEIAPLLTQMTIMPAMVPFLSGFIGSCLVQLQRRISCEDQRAFLVMENSRLELNTQRASEEFSHFRGSLLREVVERRAAEKERESSEEMLRLLLSSTGEAIYGVNAEGACTFANESCLKQLGYGHLREILGRNMHDLIQSCPQDGRVIPAHECRLLQAIKKGAAITVVDERFWRRDGTSIPVEYSAYPIRKNNRIVGGVVTWRDVSERQQAEAALKSSEAKLSALFTSMTEMVVLHELVFNGAGKPVNYRLIDCNRAYTRITGITREAAVGRLGSEVYGTSEPPYFKEFSQVAITGQSYHYETYFPPMKKHFLISVVSPQKHQFATITTDITELKEALEALRLKNLVFDESLAANSIADLQGNLTEANDMFLRIWGYATKSDVLGRPLKAFLADLSDIEVIVKALNEVGQWEGDYIARKQDGSTFVAHGMATTVRNEANQVIGYQSSVIDVTARKQAEAELLKAQKLSSLGLLAGGIAHDFNNILMGLFGNLSLAKKYLPPDAPAFASLGNAELAMNRAIRLTKQLLTFAKGGDPVTEDVSLGELIEEVARFDLTGSNVTLVYQQVDGLWMAKVDRGQIQQVISNLTINARQAMHSGGRLFIAVENAEVQDNTLPLLRPDNYLKITVRDEGCGIDPNAVDQIFDPYFTNKHNGIGLGLATTYSIITKHGGHIGVVSEQGKGTTFTLYLPASDVKSVAKKRAALKTPAPLLRPLKILVLDDEEFIRMLIPRWLRPLNCAVTTCESGRKAVDLYRHAREAGAPFDLLILDLTIPGGIGGHEVLREILVFDPKAMAVVSSGYAEGPIMANYESYGFKGVLTKPYTEEQLLDLVRRVLE